MNKELNKEILDSITTHKDFGVMNPVDIGVRCGYKEVDVQEVIEGYCPVEKVCNDGIQDKYYFVFSDDTRGYYAEGRTEIIAFDLYKRSVTVLKCFDEKQCIVKIRATIYAKSKIGTQYVYWENIETGESGVFDIGLPVYDILVVEDGIVVACVPRERYKRIIKVNFKGERKTLEIETPNYYGQTLVEFKNKIYEIENDNVWRIDEDFNTIQKLEKGNCNSIFAYGFGDDEIYFYTRKGEFSYNNIETQMCTEEMVGQFRYSSPPGIKFHIMETKTYRVLGDTILNKETQQCFKIRSLSQGSSFIIGRNEEERSQVVSLYSRNIVLFVRSGSMIGVLDLNSGVESYYEPLDL